MIETHFRPLAAREHFFGQPNQKVLLHDVIAELRPLQEHMFAARELAQELTGSYPPISQLLSREEYRKYYRLRRRLPNWEGQFEWVC